LSDYLDRAGTTRQRLWLVALLAAVWLTTIGACDATATDAQLWALLKEGGQAVLIRHALTTPGVGDPPGFRLDDCATQRNLTDEGRCLETARLAFGTATPATPLSNLFGRSAARDEQVREMRPMLGERRPGANLVLVTHGSTIAAVTGINPDTTEMVIVTPQGGERFTVTGRLSAR
jgi:hypothetical protein